MSDLIKTLHKKGDNTVNVYPNIKSENIPDNAITTAKISDNAITKDKLSDASISTNKLQNGAVTTAKILAGAVTYSKIADGAVNNEKLSDNAVKTNNIFNGSVTNDKLAEESVKAINLDTDLYEMLLRTNYTYMVYLGNNNDTSLHFFKTTTLDSSIHDYTEDELSDALDFDKNIGDYTSTDISILKDIIDGMIHEGLGAYDFHTIISDTVQFDIYISNVNHYYITMKENGVYTFKLEFDEDLNIIELVNTSYIYMYIVRMINPNVHYE